MPRHILRRDLPRAIDTLVSAFWDDPVTSWIFRDETSRARQLRTWMRFNLELGLARGHTYCIESERACAIWAPPDTQLFDAHWGPRMAELLSELIGERAGPVMEGLARGMIDHESEEPHFYLFVLGTHRDAQGGGLGGRLIDRVLQTCDREGLVAMLESSNPRNVSFYERHGFEVIDEVELEAGGPVLRPMRRMPR